jgi:hypothetical protein
MKAAICADGRRRKSTLGNDYRVPRRVAPELRWRRRWPTRQPGLSKAAALQEGRALLLDSTDSIGSTSCRRAVVSAAVARAVLDSAPIQCGGMRDEHTVHRGGPHGRQRLDLLFRTSNYRSGQ